MASYRIKVSVFDWFIHGLILVLAAFLAALTANLKTKPGPSFEQSAIHVVIVVGMIFNLFVLYKKKTAFVEIDKYSIRYHNFRIALQINLTDIVRIERTGTNVLTCYTADKKVLIPLNIENSSGFINSFIKIIETVNYRIEFDRDNLLNFNRVQEKQFGVTQ